MRNFLYVLIAIVITLWIIGFFIYSLGGLLHILLVIALILIIITAIKNLKRNSNNH